MEAYVKALQVFAAVDKATLDHHVVNLCAIQVVRMVVDVLVHRDVHVRMVLLDELVREITGQVHALPRLRTICV